MKQTSKRGLTIAIALVAVAATVESSEHRRLRAALHTTSRLVAAPEGRCSDEPGHPPVIGLLQVAGAGETTLIGTVTDEQSHCVWADASFFDGRFTLTGARGRTVHGVYRGHLEPTCDYEPAHGLTNLSTGDATIFLDQRIRVD